MSVAKLSLTASTVLLGISWFLLVPANGQEIKGQIKVGLHNVKLEKGKLYQITLLTTSNVVPEIDMKGAELIRVLAKEPLDDVFYFLPNRTDEYPFYVTYASYGKSFPEKATIDYKLKFKAMELAAKPVLVAEDKLTEMDDLYRKQNKFYKPYKLSMKAGKTYVIDMVKDGVRDPFLYLENAKGDILATDDDSGGDLNARLVYSPPEDGDFTVIATTMQKETGGYILTVRGTK